MAVSDSELFKMDQEKADNINKIMLNQNEQNANSNKTPDNPNDGTGSSTEVQPKEREPSTKRKRKYAYSSSSEEEDSSSSESDNGESSSSESSSSSNNSSLEESSNELESSDSDTQRRKNKKKKGHKRKKNKRSRTESKSNKEDRFNPTSQEEKTSWKLSKSKASYVRKNFNTYISEKTLKDSILEKYPVPKNAGKPKELDTFMKDMYYDSKKNFVCESDKKLRKVQQKLYDVMGPLGTLWKNLSKTKKNSTKTVSGPEIIELLDQSVVLLGQANNSLNFIRRLTGLTSLGIDKIQAASMLKESSEDFKPKSDKLFGKNFYKTLKHRSKDLKLSRSLIRDLKKKPNRQGPSGKGAPSLHHHQNRAQEEGQRPQREDRHNNRNYRGSNGSNRRGRGGPRRGR
ncbi:cylicin-2-like [Clytia hemisphaerica]|uniref:cylicin-2-like n=1 Tax=Clytia hemisphaerica TaxID=252671 RepID=UPI0034D6782E